MTKNKRFEWCEEIKGNFVDEYVKDNITGKSLDEEDMFHLLNEQDERIQELEQENKRLKQGKYIYGIHGGSND